MPPYPLAGGGDPTGARPDKSGVALTNQRSGRGLRHPRYGQAEDQAKASWLTRASAIGGGSAASFRWQRIFLMTSPCVIGCGSVHVAALPTNGTGMPQRIFIRKGCLPVSEVAERPGNGLSPSEFRIPQGFARGSTSKVHLRHQIVGKLIVYLNAAALRVRHQ